MVYNSLMLSRLLSLLLFLPILLISNMIIADDDLPYSVLNLPHVLPRALIGESCVEPVDVMRKKHMQLLFHQRDKTMYQGARDEKHSLTGCVSCHAQISASGEFIGINVRGQFCEVCHVYTAVKMDCFECHANKPDKKSVNNE